MYEPPMPARRRVLRWMTLTVLLGSVVGCSSTPPQANLADEQVHILKALRLSNEYRGKNKRFPTSNDELKAFAKSLPASKLKELGIDNVDQALTSPRDQQPYQFLKPANPMESRGMMSVLIYEKNGVNGKYMTASSMGQARELSDEEMKQVLSGR